MSKTILITGANGGLGSTVVQKFLSNGYTVIGADHSEHPEDPAQRQAQYEHHVVNLADEAATGAFIASMIARHQKIDAALLLVGGYAGGDIHATDGQALQKMFSINFHTAYYCARPLFEHMRQQGYGRIVLMGAKPALNHAAGKGALAYALSKSLLFRLADLLNETAKGTNVVCSVVAPSTIDTEANRRHMPDADTHKWVQPEQIADLMAFICSSGGDALREPVYKVYHNA